MERKNASNSEPDDDLGVLSKPANGIERSVDRNTAEKPGDEQIDSAEHTVHLRSPSFTDRPTRIIATVGLFATLIGLGVNYYTLRAVKGQLRSMNAALIEHQRQSNASEGSLALAKSVAASADRPWVSAEIESSTPITPGSFAHITSRFTNVGKSPALGLHVKTGIFLEPEQSDHAADMNPNTILSTTILYPNDSVYNDTGGEQAVLTGSNFRAMISNSLIYYVLMSVDYKDSSGITHHSRSCRVFNPESSKYVGCDKPEFEKAD